MCSTHMPIICEHKKDWPFELQTIEATTATETKPLAKLNNMQARRDGAIISSLFSRVFVVCIAAFAQKS